jgi:hypothetical protein
VPDVVTGTEYDAGQAITAAMRANVDGPHPTTPFAQ